MNKNLIGIIAGLGMTIAGATLSFFQNDALTNSKLENNPRISKTIQLKEQTGKTIEEKLNYNWKVSKNNEVNFGVYTQNYNNQEWGAKEIQYKQFTNINDTYSKLYVIHPQEIQIKNKAQRAYLVPKHKWVEMTPYKKNKSAKLIIKGGKLAVKEVGNLIPLPFKKQFQKKFMEYSEKKYQQKLNNKLEAIAKNCTLTEIKNMTTKGLGQTKTAQEWTIEFENDSEQKAPIYLWSRIALGNPSQATSGEALNRFGGQEEVVQILLNPGKTLEEKIKSKDSSFTGIFKKTPQYIGVWECKDEVAKEKGYKKIVNVFTKNWMLIRTFSNSRRTRNEVRFFTYEVKEKGNIVTIMNKEQEFGMRMKFSKDKKQFKIADDETTLTFKKKSLKLPKEESMHLGTWKKDRKKVLILKKDSTGIAIDQKRKKVTSLYYEVNYDPFTPILTLILNEKDEARIQKFKMKFDEKGKKMKVWEKYQEEPDEFLTKN